MLIQNGYSVASYVNLFFFFSLKLMIAITHVFALCSKQQQTFSNVRKQRSETSLWAGS